MELETEYNYGDDYGELFKTFVLNMSSDDFINISLNLQDNTTNGKSNSAETNYTDWLFALNVISGIGVLTNSILIFMIIVDFVIDKKRRFWSRHWLLLNTAITHVSYLGIGIYMREFGYELNGYDRQCLIIQHTDKTIEFVIILYLIIISINVIANIVRPYQPCGKRNIMFWIFFILFIMVCGNLAILGLFTMKLDSTLKFNSKCELDATSVLPPNSIHLISIVTFYVPYGILLILALSSLLCSCAQQRKLTPPLTTDNENCISRKHSAVYIFITATAGFLFMLPFYSFQVPEVYNSVLSAFSIEAYSVYFITVLIKLLYYITFPMVCLCLLEIRDIYRKAVDNA